MAGVTVGELVRALDSTVLEALGGVEVTVASVALVEAADLVGDGSGADLHLHVGVSAEQTARWLAGAGHRPRAVMTKVAAEPVRAAARDAGVALVAVHPQARWDHLLPMVQGVLDRSRRRACDPELAGTDLFDLAQAVARDAGGMVSIEDAQSRVLAYSASDDSADELRTLSILGRQGPPDYLRALRDWGVFDRLRSGDEVVDVPAHDRLGTRRRLVVSIRQPPTYLGSIWVQQGDKPFTAEAEEVLRGAAAIAARTILRDLEAPSTEAVLIQRLFGARGGGVDAPSLAGALNLPHTGRAAVVGFAAETPGVAPVRNTLRLLASAFRRDSLVTVIGDRAYLLLPGYTTAEAVTAWTRHLVDEFESTRATRLRAAIALPVPDLAHVATARTEVDRVLDATPAHTRVTTLAESRTAVLLGEILDLLATRPDLHDPRLTTLAAYDRDHATDLVHSTHTHLTHHGDTRAAATDLTVHPNTLRYRLRRAEQITGLTLADPGDRLLLELQLALLGRARG